MFCLTLKPLFFLTAPGFTLLTLQRSTVRVRAHVHAVRSAEVMGSRRKVRSRVHGGVKEARDRLLFAPPPPRFLPTGGCGPGGHSGLTEQQPRKRAQAVCFAARMRPSPGRKTAASPRQPLLPAERFAALLSCRTVLLFAASMM